jgi:hypothetical protein
VSNAGSMPLPRRDCDDPPQGSPPTLRTVEIIFFILVLVFLSYGERIPIGP